MFHRPKPETQNETTSTQNNQSSVAVVSSQNNNTAPQSATQTMTSATAAGSTTNTMAQQTGKDAQTMTKDDEQKTTTTQDQKSVDIPTSTTSSPFQRPAATPAAPAKPYGSYNPTTYAGSTPAVGAGSGNGRRLVIGEGITMSGEIESCDHLLVEGSVEAALKGAKVLEISESGKFYGSVEIEEATIAGHFEGEVNVSGRLTVASTGVITGTIVYGELQIEAGATIDGRLAPMGATSSNKKTKGKGAAKSDGELPMAS